VDSEKISVSGLSSGGYFAVQFHVAFSKTIMGAGILAGGPFWCAQDNLPTALTTCMISPALISVTELVTITYNTAATETIDPPSYLNNDHVYLFSGTLDTVVNPGVMKKLQEYYSNFVTDGTIYTEFSIPAEHAMVGLHYGRSCDYGHMMVTGQSHDYLCRSQMTMATSATSSLLPTSTTATILLRTTSSSKFMVTSNQLIAVQRRRRM